MAKASRGDDQYMVRFPPGLRDRIKEAAVEQGRSMNSEIISRLEASFAIDDGVANKPLYFNQPPAIDAEAMQKILEEVTMRANRIAFAEIMRRFGATPGVLIDDEALDDDQ